ncbi:MAG TPA: ATP-binding protein [Spirochaetota bacterium]|nr:ATP-binding protein [Spirochaetota bacterium]
MYVTRTLEHYFIKAARQFPVVLVTGARQVGKTTFLKHLCEKNRTYVTLDDPLIQTMAKDDPALFLQRYHPPVVIDEIQYAPELLPYIKIESDRQKNNNLFWLTGSQYFHTMQGITESLAGRVGIINLSGLSLLEAKGLGNKVKPFLFKGRINSGHPEIQKLSLKELYTTIWRGSFPAMALNKHIDWNLFYSSYVQTYLQRDVSFLSQVGNITAFTRFMRAAAARTAQLLNISELARDADISVNTAKRWLSVLVSSGVVFLLEPYYSNVSKRLIKSPKLYFLDTGLCCWLTNWTTPETLETGAFSGPIFETWVFGEILKTWIHNGLQPSFHFYRDKDQKEIDLLIIKDGIAYPVEIKKTAMPGKSDLHYNILTKSSLTIGPGCIICLVDEPIPVSNDVYALPVTYI